MKTVLAPIYRRLDPSGPGASPSYSINQRKALLIGISYAQNTHCPELKSSHHDLDCFEHLLTSQMGYLHENVVVLKDDPALPEMSHPTKANIVSEMAALALAARAGDHLLFYYIGHGDHAMEEIVAIEGEEGLHANTQDPAVLGHPGQAIVPCDAIENTDFIINSKMRKILVDGIPSSCTMTAIFDSCFSGTALDLDHYCNSYFIPWLHPVHLYTTDRQPNSDRPKSKPSASRHEKPEEGQALGMRHLTFPTDASTVNGKSKLRKEIDIVAAHRLVYHTKTKTKSTNELEDKTAVRSITQDARVRQNSAEPQVQVPARFQFRGLSTRSQSVAGGSASRSAMAETSTTEPKRCQKLRKRSATIDPLTLRAYRTLGRRLRETCKAVGAGIRFMCPLRRRIPCPGSIMPSTSRPSTSAVEAGIPGAGARVRGKSKKDGSGPHVISVSACSDHQLTFDNPSLTQAIVDVLKKEPHISYRSFMTRLSHELYEGAADRQAWVDKHPELRENPATKAFVEPSEPVLGSMRRLHMEDDFVL